MSSKIEIMQATSNGREKYAVIVNEYVTSNKSKFEVLFDLK